MKSKATFTKRDFVAVLGCVVFLLMNIGAVGSGGRKRAKDAVCLSNLRQWGVIFQTYANDHDGYFMRWLKPRGSPPPSGENWVRALRPYYLKGDIRLCPMAKKLSNPDENWSVPPGRWPVGAKFTAWGYIPKNWYPGSFDAGDYGSYGINNWVYNPPAEYNRILQCETRDMWRTPNVKGASNIPLLLDCVWTGGAPFAKDPPPAFEGLIWQAMTRFCIDRHNGAINGLFLDFSVRKIGLKELYTLKWGRAFNINGRYTIAGNNGDEEACAAIWDSAAPWMEDMPEY